MAGAIVLALVVSLGWLWWTNRDNTPQVGDQEQVTARVEGECIGLRFEYKGVVLSDTWGVHDVRSPPPEAWRGGEVAGTVVITDRDGPLVRGTFTADGIDVPVAGSTGTYYGDAACWGWPDEGPAGA